MAKIITSGNSAVAASPPSAIGALGKVRGAANGITLSPDNATTRASVGSTTAIVPYVRSKTGADLSGARLLTLLATGIALVSPPALSQGAAGPGAPATVPQPQVVPTPQAPRGPVLIPNPPAVAPTSGVNAPQALPNKSEPVIIYGNGVRAAPGAGTGKAPQTSTNKSEPVIIYGNAGRAAPGAEAGNAQQAPVGGQERSRAPLPAGYGYDATGRIVYTGR